MLLATIIASPGRAAEKTPGAGTPEGVTWPATFSFGRAATRADVERWDIDVSADGKGLPAGSGTAAAGKAIYAAKCALCHGTGAEAANVKLTAVALVKKGGPDFKKGRTIGNFWPYASTLFDYTRRAMPFNAPGSLTNDEVYAVTAYILAENQVMDAATVLDASSLPKVSMPARALFVPDDRKGGPEVK